MHEILTNLPASALVLDLGCEKGSFSRTATAAMTIRVDRNILSPAQYRSRQMRPDSLYAIGVCTPSSRITASSMSRISTLASAKSDG